MKTFLVYNVAGFFFVTEAKTSEEAWQKIRDAGWGIGVYGSPSDLMDYPFDIVELKREKSKKGFGVLTNTLPWAKGQDLCG